MKERGKGVGDEFYKLIYIKSDKLNLNVRLIELE